MAGQNGRFFEDFTVGDVYQDDGDRTRGVNQDGAVCIDYERTILVYQRGSSPVKDLFLDVQPPLTDRDP